LHHALICAYRETLEEYCEEQDKLMSRISELISEGLGLRTSYLNDYFTGKYQQQMQVNYYPPCPQPDVTMGLRKHSDNNLLTLILQDSTAGLQVKKDGQWITVKPTEGWFVVNVGDQIEVHPDLLYVTPWGGDKCSPITPVCRTVLSKHMCL
jgi:isopenicillin N synthase-like dioxygenase